MKHRNLSLIKSYIRLPDGEAMAAAAADKRNRRPVSTSSRGLLKCSGKWLPDRIARVRAINLAAATGR